MLDDGTRVSDDSPELLLDAGYTYFGQFVAHDLTKDVSSVDEAWRKEPEELENLQTPRLNLDVLYGSGPDNSPELYENDAVRLKVGSPGTRGTPFDICVGQHGECVLADDRGAENLILRQMTAVFARLHNFAVEQFRAETACPRELFQRAQRQTRWQFQYLAVHDYLRSVLNPNVYQRIFVEENANIEWTSFSIPVEFSVAAMRFGHAMVRPNYLFDLGQEMFLPGIFGRIPDRGPLNHNLEINWGFFFQGAGPGSAVTSRPIDTRLAPPFQTLPPDLIGTQELKCPFSRVTENPSQLAVRTLLRGAGLRIISGQRAARARGHELLTDQQLTTDSSGEETDQGRILKQSGLNEETPLWYYILKESEVRENGNRLGPLGSDIVGETIHAALRADKNSYLNRSGRIPPVWEFADGETQIYSFSELFRSVSLVCDMFHSLN
ncbi:MAG: hypothetical protein QOH39_3402 [Verrucomicrobiota bacterium]